MFEKVDSFVAANNFQDGSIDMCYLDANHCYEFISRDIAAYWPKMKGGGTLAGHDWSDEGVRKAVSEFCLDRVIEYHVDLKQDTWRIQV